MKLCSDAEGVRKRYFLSFHLLLSSRLASQTWVESACQALATSARPGGFLMVRKRLMQLTPIEQNPAPSLHADN